MGARERVNRNKEIEETRNGDMWVRRRAEGVRFLGPEFRYPIQGISHLDLSYTTLVRGPVSKVQPASFGLLEGALLLG